MPEYIKKCNTIKSDETLIIGSGRFYTKLINGSTLRIGDGDSYSVTCNVSQQFNWFQKLMWKLCFGVKIEDYSETEVNK